jgi:two-component system, OmpR family, response regulator RpaA
MTTEMLRASRNGCGREVYTTGQVARMCHVAPRTVCKWFDTGQIQGYRIPGSEDRRIPRREVLRFVRRHGIPWVEDQLAHRILLISPDIQLFGQLTKQLPEAQGYEVGGADAGLDAGRKLEAMFPECVILDGLIGRSEALREAWQIRGIREHENTLLIALVSEDEPQERDFYEYGCDQVLRKPFDPAELEAIIRARFEV